MRSASGVFAWALCVALAPALVGEPGSQPEFSPPEPTLPQLTPPPLFEITVANCQTRVLFAAVHLVINPLRVEDGYLVGSYAITVPLKSSKDETGDIRLPLHANVSPDVLITGGTLSGRGKSHRNPDHKRLITCEFQPDASGMAGEVKLSIELEDRTLEFTSTYQKAGDLVAAIRRDQAKRDAAPSQPIDEATTRITDG